MSVNYLAWVSWGAHGKTTARYRANLWASWGIFSGLPAPAGGIAIAAIVDFYRRLRG